MFFLLIIAKFNFVELERRKDKTKFYTMDKILEKSPKIKQRILYFIELQKITKTEFCQKTGISYSNIKGTASKSELGGDQISKILEVYTELNPEWLLLGKGEMLRNSSIINTGIGQFVGNNNNNKINLDLRSYSDSPEVLRAHIDELERMLQEKDEQIKVKDDQIDKLLDKI